MRRASASRTTPWLLALAALLAAGCTGPREYVRNGFKVGPSYGEFQGTTAPNWIDEADQRVQDDCMMVAAWWSLFQDPTLDSLIASASSQNLSLREAGFRILEARAQYAIAKGNIWPQSQSMFGGYQRQAASQVANSAPGFEKQFYDQWAGGFNLSWELDFWGRFRRAITSAENTLEASSADYNQVLVTLQADVATNYVLIRTLQQRLEYVRANTELQRKVLDVADRRLQAGSRNASDFHQAGSTLAQTEAQIPQLELGIRQACNRLCVLLGMPPTDLEKLLGIAPIPTTPATVVIGLPCELLRRRPDVRRAERLAHAQAEQIGIAEADLYPAFAINGTLGYQAENFSQLWQSKAMAATVGPVFQWNLLNYGRIVHNVRLQEAHFNTLLTEYQHTVLRANQEVEDGIATFLNSQERAVLLDKSVNSAKQAVDIIAKEYAGGATDFNRVALLQQNLVVQQDQQAQAHGEIAQGMIQIYRALGGGWQVQHYYPQQQGPVEIHRPLPEDVPATRQDLDAAPMPPVPPAAGLDSRPGVTVPDSRPGIIMPEVRPMPSAPAFEPSFEPSTEPQPMPVNSDAFTVREPGPALNYEPEASPVSPSLPPLTSGDKIQPAIMPQPTQRASAIEPVSTSAHVFTPPTSGKGKLRSLVPDHDAANIGKPQPLAPATPVATEPDVSTPGKVQVAPLPKHMQ